MGFCSKMPSLPLLDEDNWNQPFITEDEFDHLEIQLLVCLPSDETSVVASYIQHCLKPETWQIVECMFAIPTRQYTKAYRTLMNFFRYCLQHQLLLWEVLWHCHTKHLNFLQERLCLENILQGQPYDFPITREVPQIPYFMVRRLQELGADIFCLKNMAFKYYDQQLVTDEIISYWIQILRSLPDGSDSLSEQLDQIFTLIEGLTPNLGHDDLIVYKQLPCILNAFCRGNPCPTQKSDENWNAVISFLKMLEGVAIWLILEKTCIEPEIWQHLQQMCQNQPRSPGTLIRTMKFFYGKN